MSRYRTSFNLVFAVLLLVAASNLSAASCGDEYCINWYSIDAGGVLLSESADQQWTLSGTIGQWDATEARELAGGGWRLTGGFWSLGLEALADFLFQDRFAEADG